MLKTIFTCLGFRHPVPPSQLRFNAVIDDVCDVCREAILRLFTMR